MLPLKLKVLFPDIDFLKDCILKDDSRGKGPYIKKWNRAEPQPTQAKLDAVSVPDNATIQAKMDADVAQKKQDIIDNLPSWQQVSIAVDSISDLSEAKIFIKKLSRVVYWLAKNDSD